MKKEKVCIAQIQTAHGIKGLVKLRCYLEDPADLAAYNPLEAENGTQYTLHLKNQIKGDWLAEIAGISDRTTAEKLRGTLLYVDRDHLPETADDEFYIEDLVGCKAILASGEEVGEVIGVDNFGASDLIEIRPQTGKPYYLPMAPPYVGEIDVESGTITVEPAEEFMS